MVRTPRHRGLRMRLRTCAEPNLWQRTAAVILRRSRTALCMTRAECVRACRFRVPICSLTVLFSAMLQPNRTASRSSTWIWRSLRVAAAAAADEAPAAGGVLSGRVVSAISEIHPVHKNHEHDLRNVSGMQFCIITQHTCSRCLLAQHEVT